MIQILVLEGIRIFPLPDLHWRTRPTWFLYIQNLVSYSSFLRSSQKWQLPLANFLHFLLNFRHVILLICYCFCLLPHQPYTYSHTRSYRNIILPVCYLKQFTVNIQSKKSGVCLGTYSYILVLHLGQLLGWSCEGPYKPTGCREGILFSAEAGNFRAYVCQGLVYHST